MARCRTPCECVDRNLGAILYVPGSAVALYVSAWIEIRKSFMCSRQYPVVALYVSAWIESYATLTAEYPDIVAPAE